LAKKKRFRYRYILILLILLVVGIFYSRSRITLRNIIIKGTERKEEILSQLSLRKDVKLFNINEAKIKEKIFTLPWIKDVKVHRFFTGDLALFITERKPIAYFRGSKPMGVENDGLTFPLDSIPNSIPELLGGDFSPDALGWATTFISFISNKAFCKTIYTSPGGPITYYKGLKIVWGKGNYRKKERYLEEILRMKTIKKGILDMRFNKQVVYKKGGKKWLKKI